MILKPKKTKRGLLHKMFSIFAVAAFFTVFFAPMPASAQAPGGKAGVVTLRLVSAWTSPDIGNYGIEKLVDRINKQSKIVRIDFKGGGEVVPVLEGFNYVSRGMVDLYHHAPAFYAGNLPGALAAFPIYASPRAIRESGFWDVYDKMHRTKGVTTLGFMWRGELHGIFVNKPVSTTADFKGMKIRSSAMFEPILKKLGVSTVTTAPGDIYTALEKGVVDGFCYPYGPSFMEKSWHEVVKYVVDPPLPYQTTGILLANAKTWDGLSPQVKKEIMDAILQLEPEIYKFYRDEAPKKIRAAIDKGLLKESKLTPSEAKIFNAMAKESMWNDILVRSPEYGPKLKELGEKAEKIESQMKR